MNTLIVYDSQYGNTQKIAQSMAAAIGSAITPVNLFKPSNLISVDFLIVGSPTHGGRPTPAIAQFLNQLPRLDQVKVAAFDTGFDAAAQKTWLRLLIKIIGYAAPKIGQKLLSSGGKLIGTQNFIVTSSSGPLKTGELDRAIAWVQSLV